MESNELIARITPIFRDIFDDDYLQITRETSARDIDEWDSLSHIRLLVAHEVEFGVKFQTTEISGLRNVGDFVDLLRAKLEV